MAAELDARYQEIDARAAGDVARAGLVELACRRAPNVAGGPVRAPRRDHRGDGARSSEDAELRALADDYKRSLTELQDRLIVLPDIEDELARRRAERKAADPAG